MAATKSSRLQISALLLLALASNLQHVQCSSHSVLFAEFDSDEDRAEEKAHADRLVESTKLQPDPILDTFPKQTAREFIDNEHRNEPNRKVIGILVENYSQYVLTDPKTSKKKNCGANREVSGIGNHEQAGAMMR